MTLVDPVELTQDLVRCQSVTPIEGGALTHLAKILRRSGFTIEMIDRGGVSNMFARWGEKGHPRTFGFNGHTDVVPVGNAVGWTHPPFGADIRDGKIWGRGACDMKSGVAAFVAAATGYLKESRPDGAVVIAITGDEEGDAVDGTAAILDWMADNGEAISHCLVGEPTCPVLLGDAMKIGRRGSMTVYLTAKGKQGHAAYPQRARNAAAALTKLTAQLMDHELDQGTDHFEPSTLALTTIDTGNPASNVIPAQAQATLNIRFNDAHTSDGLMTWLRAEADAIAQKTNVSFEIRVKVSGESFVTEPGELSQLVSSAVFAETERRPKLSTTGGTSDARFIASHCPVVEFGLVGQSMHQVDEHVSIDDITGLTAIYRRVLEGYFA